MKRIVRLTENDLARIVRRVINESEGMTLPTNLGFGIGHFCQNIQNIYPQTQYHNYQIFLLLEVDYY